MLDVRQNVSTWLSLFAVDCFVEHQILLSTSENCSTLTKIFVKYVFDGDIIWFEQRKRFVDVKGCFIDESFFVTETGGLETKYLSQRNSSRHCRNVSRYLFHVDLVLRWKKCFQRRNTYFDIETIQHRNKIRCNSCFDVDLFDRWILLSTSNNFVRHRKISILEMLFRLETRNETQI